MTRAFPSLRKLARSLLLLSYGILAGAGQFLHNHPLNDPDSQGADCTCACLSVDGPDHFSGPVSLKPQTEPTHHHDGCAVCAWTHAVKSRFAPVFGLAVVAPWAVPLAERPRPERAPAFQTPPSIRAPPQVLSSPAV